MHQKPNIKLHPPQQGGLQLPLLLQLQLPSSPGVRKLQSTVIDLTISDLLNPSSKSS